MERNRNQKLLMIIALVLGIVSLSIGFAAFSVSLNISSQATISPNSDTFSVKFSTNKDSLVVSAVTPSDNPYNLTTTNGTIDNSTNPIIKNLSVTFTEPGQYVEYTFYARNEGEYTAYLNNINFIGNKTCTGNQEATNALVQMACESINITTTIGNVTYTETTPITGHTLNKKTGEQVKIRLEYSANGTYVDGPFTINFPYISVVYSTLDDSSITPTLPTVRLISGDLNITGSEVCIKDECFYLISSSEQYITMLSKMNITIKEFPMQSETAGTVKFSNDAQKGENYSDYSGSSVEYYVNNYSKYLESLGVLIQESRLINKTELEALGCASNSCSKAPSWIYETEYWTGTSRGTGTIYVVFKSDLLGFDWYYVGRGIRPVITISKSEF